MQYYSGENNCGNIGGDMLRGGDYACLVQGAGNTVRQGIAVEPRLLDLSMHKKTPERNNQ